MNPRKMFLAVFVFALVTVLTVPELSNATTGDGGVSLRVKQIHRLPDSVTTPGTATVTFQIKSGPHAGDTITYSQHLWGHPQYDPSFKPGKHFTGQVRTDRNGRIQQLLLHHDRKDYKFVVIFFVLTLLLFTIGRWEGLVGLFSTVVTILMIYYVFFPYLTQTHAILPLGLVVCLITIVLTVSLVMKWDQPTWPAIFSLAIVFFVIVILTIAGIHVLNLDATKARHSRLILSWMDQEGRLWRLLTVGIVLGTLGALMDVAVVVSSTVHEIVRDSTRISVIDAFRSGVKVGREILSTMLNTLIFAYMSILFPILLSFRIFKLSFLQFVNYDFVGFEILRICVGLIGLSLIIPTTAMLTAWWCCRQ